MGRWFTFKKIIYNSAEVEKCKRFKSAKKNSVANRLIKMQNDRFVWRELEKKGFCNFVYIVHSFDFFFYGKKCAKYIPNLAYDITVYDITVYIYS